MFIQGKKGGSFERVTMWSYLITIVLLMKKSKWFKKKALYEGVFYVHNITQQI